MILNKIIMHFSRKWEYTDRLTQDKWFWSDDSSVENYFNLVLIELEV